MNGLRSDIDGVRVTEHATTVVRTPALSNPQSALAPSASPDPWPETEVQTGGGGIRRRRRSCLLASDDRSQSHADLLPAYRQVVAQISFATPHFRNGTPLDWRACGTQEMQHNTTCLVTAKPDPLE